MTLFTLKPIGLLLLLLAVTNGATAQNVGIGVANPSARLDVAGGNVEIDLNRFLGHSASDVFTYNGFTMGHYSIGWFNDPQWSASGGSNWLSGYASIKFFTAGTPRATFDINGRLGIGTMTPNTSLDVAGAVAYRPTALNLTADNQIVVVGNSSYHRLASTDVTAANRDFRLTQGLQAGQVLTLEGTGTGRSRIIDNALCRNAANTADAGNVRLNGDMTFAANATLSLVFNGTDWVEIGRNPEPWTAPTGFQNFTYTGGDQAFVVPAGVTQISVKLWGASGGGGRYGAIYNSGAGGYTQITLNVTPGDAITVRVGGGGGAGAGNYSGVGGWPNGGNGQAGDVGAGGGGGRSEILVNGTRVAVAGGGGGGTGYCCDAGAGGGNTGQSAFGGSGGTGGSQVAGGTDPSGNPYGCPGVNIKNGGFLFGGNGSWSVGCTGDDGGGGGDGYYGGGGGGGDGQAGGGGSGYLNTGFAGYVSGTNLTGNYQTPPNTGDADYPGGNVAVGIPGSGGANGTPGNPGYVRIAW